MGIELVNVGFDQPRRRSSPVSAAAPEPSPGDPEVVEVGERRLVRLSDLVPESVWMGAVVEVESGELVVEQTYVGDPTGIDRAPCHSRTSTSWFVASGATRRSSSASR